MGSIHQRGFSWITLLVAVVLLVVLIVGVGFFWPLPIPGGIYYKGQFQSNREIEDGMASSRDLVRLTDFANFEQAFKLLPNSAFCKESSVCRGSSMEASMDIDKSRATDGTGWLKVDLTKFQMSYLPIDPNNSQAFHYTFCADQRGWELITVFESSKYLDKMKNDGGNDPNKYEIGTNLSLLGTPNCQY